LIRGSTTLCYSILYGYCRTGAVKQYDDAVKQYDDALKQCDDAVKQYDDAENQCDDAVKQHTIPYNTAPSPKTLYCNVL
jgi:hypothetical protein